jgi:hypothetical protein
VGFADLSTSVKLALVRSRKLLVLAWVVACALMTSTAWAAVSKVASRVTNDTVPVLSGDDVESALSDPTPTFAAPTTTVTDSMSTAPTTTLVDPPTTTVAATPTVTAAPTRTVPTTTAAENQSDDPPPTAAPTSTSPTTTRAATSTTVGGTQYITTPGGTLAVQCIGNSQIRVVSAAPAAGYTYVPGEVTPYEIHVRFVKVGKAWSIEAKCVGGRLVSSIDD